MQMWLYGTGAGAHWPSNQILVTKNDTRQHFNIQLKGAEGGEPHALECIAYAKAIANGEPSPVPAEQSLDVLTILDGLYRSAATGKEVMRDTARDAALCRSSGVPRAGRPRGRRAAWSRVHSASDASFRPFVTQPGEGTATSVR